jgi:hypothetical protein
MTPKTTLFPAIVVALVAVPALSIAQTVTIKYRQDDGTASTLWASPAAIRAQVVGLSDVIEHVDQGTMLMVDHQQKTYKEESVEAFRETWARRAAERHNPRMEEAARKHGLSTETTVTDLGAGESIIGYPTKHYRVKAFTMDTELWMTTALQLPPAYYKDFNAMALLAMADASKLTALNGVVLKRVTSMQGMGKPVTEVAISVDKGPIPAGTFEVPAGYRKTSR